MRVGLSLRRHFPSKIFVLAILLAIAGFASIFIYMGVYNIGADVPHSKLVSSTLAELRERAVANHSRHVRPPADLEDPKRVAAGAALYNEMCTGCHLGPGLAKSELSQGLYPSAPELALGNDRSAAEQFWIIKHGVKMSGMPAWGKTHDDQLIWNMVAFIRQLPELSPEQYKEAVANAPEGHEEMMEHMVGMGNSNQQHEPASKQHTHAHEHGDERSH